MSEILKPLRAKLARPLTRRRILRYKEDWLRRAGADAATIGFLTAKSPSDRAQMHYTALKQQTLLDWHLRYLGEALGISPVEQRPSGALYGSDLRLPPALLRDVFEEFRRDLRRQTLPGVGSFEQVAAAHNAFASYTLMVLYFCHRTPPGDPSLRVSQRFRPCGALAVDLRQSEARRPWGADDRAAALRRGAGPTLDRPSGAA